MLISIDSGRLNWLSSSASKKFYTTTVAVNEFINQLSLAGQSTGVSVAISRQPEQQECRTAESRRAKRHLDKIVGQVGHVVSGE
jgi:hypothetical protein